MPKSKRLRYDPSNDLYIVLGVTSGVTAAELQRAFRQRAKEVHPDLNPTRLDWANDQFRRLNEAYDVLSNPPLREEYDRLRGPYQTGKPAYAAQGQPQGWQTKPPSGTPRSSGRPSAASRAAWARQGYIKPTNPYSMDYVRWIVRRSLGGPYRRILALLVVVLTVNILFVLMFAEYFNQASLQNLGTMYFTPLITDPQQANLSPVCDATAGINVLQPPNEAIINDRTFRIVASVPPGVTRNPEIDLQAVVPLPDGTTSRWHLVSVLSQSAVIENGQLQALASLNGVPLGDFSLRVSVMREDGSVVGPCALTIHHQR